MTDRLAYIAVALNQSRIQRGFDVRDTVSPRRIHRLSFLLSAVIPREEDSGESSLLVKDHPSAFLTAFHRLYPGYIVIELNGDA